MMKILVCTLVLASLLDCHRGWRKHKKDSKIIIEELHHLHNEVDKINNNVEGNCPGYQGPMGLLIQVTYAVTNYKCVCCSQISIPGVPK